MEPKFRNELKHIITPADRASICAALGVVAEKDLHTGADGCYTVRSLYFDNLYDTALREKLDGVCDREKFRIRFYNEDLSYIRLEKKVKRGSLGYKVSAPLTEDEVRRMLGGDTAWMATSGRGLVMELYSKMQTKLLRPKAVVEYRRQAFVYAPGNVRVTLDDRIRTGVSVNDFLETDRLTIPTGDGEIILEVKWDEFLPGPIRRAVQLKNRRAGAFSKYRMSRIYG